MSSVYILEPPTSGKVLLKTTVGDIDVELWAKETPKTCRNFIQLCLEGYYNNTIFHRVVKGFIVQGGDPKGDGTGGESIYGEPFKDEFHQRLRFSRRGLLAMANAGPDDNSSQFFFTLGPTPELQEKHTLFGKITGETIFNMLKLEDGLVEDERPAYPHKILKTEVLNNPFPDIEPRIKVDEAKERKKKKERIPGVKNFKLLSFGAEAEEDEEEVVKVNEKFVGKGKSSHDILDDPKLSSKTEEASENEEEEELSLEQQLENVRNKLKKAKKKQIEMQTTSETCVKDAYESFLIEEKQKEQKKKYDEIQKEIENVKKEYHKNKLKKEEEKAAEIVDEEKNETYKEYKSEFDKYKEKTKALPKKGAERENFTLALLAKFKNKLQSSKRKLDGEEDEAKEEEQKKEENAKKPGETDDNWLTHKLKFKRDTPVLAKDANKKDDDWFEIYDPRNALNKRRRGEIVHKGPV